MTDMVYVDKLFVLPSKDKQAYRAGTRNGHQWCHMWADNTEELMKFATSIGLKPEWFQSSGKLQHFDLVPSKRRRAIANGAIETDLKQWWKSNQSRVK
jgi:hypothetical protein